MTTAPQQDPPIGASPRRTQITAIAALARNGVIGADGDIPWRISEDFRRFKRLTMGGVLVMGRKTYDSIGHPLPGRETIVVTRDRDWRAQGVRMASSIEQALAYATQSGKPIWIAGGGEIYRLAWPWTTALELTYVDQEPAGEVTFPELEPERWAETGRTPGPGCTWVSYRRLR